MSDPVDPNKLSNTFRDGSLASHGDKWDALWREQFTPWDRGGPSLALDELLAKAANRELEAHVMPLSVDPLDEVADPGQKTRSRKTALVPGCGRGHDALLLSAWGYDVFGLDYSAEAGKRAAENQAEVYDRDEVYQARDGVGGRGKVVWLAGDFFADDFLKTAATDRFDLVFDYTFLCALPPSARPLWAKRMSQLLVKDGRLVCLEWPLPKPPSEQGPPWGLTPEIYEAHLTRPGEEVAYLLDGNVDATKTEPRTEKAFQRLLRMKPARTHQTGTDENGEAHDRISVWARVQDS